MNVQQLIRFWDQSIDAFLVKGEAVPTEVRPWFEAYKGTGLGKPNEDALPEPWLGKLAKGSTRAVFLQLNPGGAEKYQHHDDLFAKEIRELGSYSAWAATWPYRWLSDVEYGPGRSESPNLISNRKFWERAARFGDVRLRFARDWFGEIGRSEVVMFELYPWHSKKLTAKLRRTLPFVKEYVWEPILDLGVEIVFAFGADWIELLPQLDVDVLADLSADELGSSVRSRRVLVGCAPGTKTLVVAEKHSGGAGPPRRDEVPMIRAVFDRLKSRS